MSRDQDVKDIVTQLQKLQIEQTALLTRLELLHESTDKGITETKREFVVRDRVLIKNPGLFTDNSGTVSKIGKRITVKGKNGRKIVRLAKNLTIYEK